MVEEAVVEELRSRVLNPSQFNHVSSRVTIESNVIMEGRLALSVDDVDGDLHQLLFKIFKGCSKNKLV